MKMETLRQRYCAGSRYVYDVFPVDKQIIPKLI